MDSIENCDICSVGVKWAFDEVGVTVEHVKDCGIRKGKHANNNRIERMNGTLRERAGKSSKKRLEVIPDTNS